MKADLYIYILVLGIQAIVTHQRFPNEKKKSEIKS